MRFILFIWIQFFIVLFCKNACGQDTLRRKQPNASFLLPPAALITTGIILNQDNIKTDFRNWVREGYAIPNTNIDDYLQHAPIAMMYLGDMIGHRSASEVSRQTRHLLVSQAITLGGVYFLKELTNEKRPNGGSRSFPSGHTSYAFAGATVFYFAYKEKSKYWAYLGYLPATITGVYRVLKDKHWVSDVVFGAGFGILSAQLSYYFNLWNSARNTVKNKDNLNFFIGMASNSTGIGAYLRF